ncbi:hypothetical protein Cgig2_008271 [Carnegiea gigantea]|uniref:Uncharacterized protein n=1 Tax=Carnegiea gigantea TaxID=171969 RepID=A0A9Q1QSY5_9CARY|nr:hypothetical protein Cgig2_008271 [Carnegiea gigantea]
MIEGINGCSSDETLMEKKVLRLLPADEDIFPVLGLLYLSVTLVLLQVTSAEETLTAYLDVLLKVFVQEEMKLYCSEMAKCTKLNSGVYITACYNEEGNWKIIKRSRSYNIIITDQQSNEPRFDPSPPSPHPGHGGAVIQTPYCITQSQASRERVSFLIKPSCGKEWRLHWVGG